MDDKIKIEDHGLGLKITVGLKTKNNLVEYDLPYCDIKSSASQDFLILSSKEASLYNDYPTTKSFYESVEHSFAGVTDVEGLSQRLEELCQASISGPITPPAKFTDVTFAEAEAHALAGTFDPMSWYRMTDHKTDYYMPETTTLNSENNDNNVPSRVTVPTERIFFRAITTHKIQSQVISETYPEDFILYTLDSGWYGSCEAPETKGAITRRHIPRLEHGDGLLTLPFNNVSFPIDIRHAHIRTWNTDLSAKNGEVNNYVLWKQSVTIGKDDTAGVASQETYNATSPTDYIDTTLLPTDQQNIDVLFESKTWSKDTHPIPNFRSSRFVRDAKFVSVNNFRLEGGIYHLHEARGINDFIQAKTPGGIEGVYSWKHSMNRIESFISTVSISNPFTELERTSIHADIANSTENNFRLFGDTRNPIKGTLLTAIKVRSNNPLHGVNLRLENVSRIIVPLDGNDTFDVNIIRNVHGGDIARFNAGAYQDLGTMGIPSDVIRIDYGKFSNLEYDIDATDINTASGVIVRDKYTPMAGTFNITDAGTVGNVEINTVERPHETTHRQVIKPVSGLIATVKPNVIINGFTQSEDVSANGTESEVVLIEPIGNRWAALPNKGSGGSGGISGVNKYQLPLLIGFGQSNDTLDRGEAIPAGGADSYLMDFEKLVVIPPAAVTLTNSNSGGVWNGATEDQIMWHQPYDHGGVNKMGWHVGTEHHLKVNGLPQVLFIEASDGGQPVDYFHPGSGVRISTTGAGWTDLEAKIRDAYDWANEWGYELVPYGVQTWQGESDEARGDTQPNAELWMDDWVEIHDALKVLLGVNNLPHNFMQIFHTTASKMLKRDRLNLAMLNQSIADDEYNYVELLSAADITNNDPNNLTQDDEHWGYLGYYRAGMRASMFFTDSLDRTDVITVAAVPPPPAPTIQESRLYMFSSSSAANTNLQGSTSWFFYTGHAWYNDGVEGWVMDLSAGGDRWENTMNHSFLDGFSWSMRVNIVNDYSPGYLFEGGATGIVAQVSALATNDYMGIVGDTTHTWGVNLATQGWCTIGATFLNGALELFLNGVSVGTYTVASYTPLVNKLVFMSASRSTLAGARGYLKGVHAINRGTWGATEHLAAHNYMVAANV